MCYALLWTNENDCTGLKLSTVNVSTTKIIQFLSDIIYVQSPIYCVGFPDKFQAFVAYKNYLQSLPGFSPNECLSVCEQEMHTTITSGNVFKCTKDVYISITYVCDGRADCPGNSTLDELDCECNNSETTKHQCKYFTNNKTRKICSMLYHSTYHGECQLFTPVEETYPQPRQTPPTLLCNNGLLLPQPFVNDLVADCGPDAEDEILGIYSQTETNNVDTCLQRGLLPCRKRHNLCFSFSDICNYRLNFYDSLVPCRTGKHLQNCKAFDCTIMYKCPEFYCIPWSYVCDGKWDCPKGYDELFGQHCGSSRLCSNMFKCQNSQMCIHLEDICDKMQHYPFGDDRIFCSLKSIQCPSDCQCLGLAVNCFGVSTSVSHLMGAFPYIAVSIQSCHVTSVQLMGDLFQHVVFLAMTHTNLAHLCQVVSPMKKYVRINASFNIITTIQTRCFVNAIHAKEILLSMNQLSTIEKEAFCKLNQLQYLDLSHNLVLQFASSVITSSDKLMLLSIENNSLHQITEKAFAGLSFDFLGTGDHHLCCILSSETKCTAKTPWYFSCKHLLPNMAVKITFYCVSVVISILNVLSIILQIVSISKGICKTGAFETTVIQVNLADVLCEIHFTVLWITDLIYDDLFALKELTWRSGFTCHFLHSIVLFHYFLSPLSLCFLSLSRLFVVLHPVDTVFKKTNFVVKTFCILYSACLVCAVAFTFTSRMLHGSLPTEFCFPVMDPTGVTIITFVLTWFTAVLLLFCVIFISVVYVETFLEVEKSQQSVAAAKSGKQSNTSLVVELFAAIGSVILSWISR